jgi:hypothetical protein
MFTVHMALMAYGMIITKAGRTHVDRVMRAALTRACTGGEQIKAILVGRCRHRRHSSTTARRRAAMTVSLFRTHGNSSGTV